MSIALLGIVLVQYFWIRNAIAIKEASFKRAVSEALQDAVLRLNRDQNILFVTNQVWVDDGEPSDRNFFENEVVWEHEDDENNSFVYVTNDSQNVSAVTVGKTAREGSFVKVESLNDSNIRHRAIIRLDSMKQFYDREQELIIAELKDSIEIMVDDKLRRIRHKSVSVTEVIDDMVFELQELDDPLEEQFSDEQVEKRISESLLDKGIVLPFSFGIYNPHSDSVYAVGTPAFDPASEQSFETRLYPESIFERPELLAIRFPGQKMHILRSMALLLSGSVFFTLIILLTFFLTIRVILQQKKLSEIKSDFINNMTHEFKTPIATISLAVDSINNPQVISKPEKIQYFTGVIEEENKRMNSSVENVLQMSLIDKKDFNLHSEIVNVHDLIESLTRKFELQVSRKKGRLSVGMNASDPLVQADALHLQNVLSNLIDNAIKYSEPGFEVNILTQDKEDFVSVTVKDNGVGMSKDEQLRIFDKFYRVPRGDIHNVKGFGLGLSYVKAIVLAHGGKIEVKSQRGQGSEFRVTLPRNVKG